ncbi:MAG TPA: helix-turn-helix domain-containing protein [Rugosimonospora sp.]|nr:helix-turn-helix domain-containing protein [Rugosimonospora sp.]
MTVCRHTLERVLVGRKEAVVSPKAAAQHGRRGAAREASASHSAPTARVVAIMELLAGTQARMSTSTIARTLGLARTTVLAINTELCAAGWLVRDANGHRIGPVFASLRREEPAPIAPRTVAVLQRLAQMARCGVTLCRVQAAELTFVARFQGGDQPLPGLPFGRRVPLQFPAGASVVPQLPARDQRRWVRSALPDQRQHAESLLSSAHRHGFVIHGPAPHDADLVDVLAQLLHRIEPEVLDAGTRHSAQEQLIRLTAQPWSEAQLTSHTALPISFLSAPVTSPTSDGVFHEIQLGPLQAKVKVDDRNRYIGLLTDASRALSATPLSSP